MLRKDLIIALATPQGVGAIGVIRISGPDSILLVERFFFTKELKLKKLSDKPSHTIHFGVIANLGQVIDEVVVSLYRAPHSYTGEESVEISCHGSKFILQQ